MEPRQRPPQRNAAVLAGVRQVADNEERKSQSRARRAENSQAASESSSSEEPSSSSSASARPAGKKGPLPLTDLDEKLDRSYKQALDEADESDVLETLYVIDIEVHSMQKENKLVSQLTAVPLSGKGPSYNAYVYRKALAKPWMDLVRSGQVELAPWDDPGIARPFPEVFIEFCTWLPLNAVLLFKGTSDLATIQLSLDRLGEPGQQAIRYGNSRGIQFLPIDGLWMEACKMLPPAARAFVFGKRKIARPLGSVYDALFWNPLLVRVTTKSEELVETIEYDIQIQGIFRDQGAEPMPMDFLLHKHLQPVWHTSHTDTLATRHITCFLFWWVHFRGQLVSDLKDASEVSQDLVNSMRQDVSADDLAFHILSTRTAHVTNLFRNKNLALPPKAYAFAYRYCIDSKNARKSLKETEPVEAEDDDDDGGFNDGASVASDGLVADYADHEDSEVDEDATIPYGDDDGDADIDVYRILDNERLHSTDKARAKLMKDVTTKANGLVVYHKDEWVLVHMPRNRDATRLRAAKSMLGIREAGPDDKSRYDVLEDGRKLLSPLADAVEDRPWYYYPTATGSQGAGVQVLHTRRCLDRKNGNKNARAKAAPANSDKIALYQFDMMTRVVGYRLKFCKECKQYEANADDVDELVGAVEKMTVTRTYPVPSFISSPYLPSVQAILAKLSEAEPVSQRFRFPLQLQPSVLPMVVFASVNSALGSACRHGLKYLEEGQRRMLVVCSEKGEGLGVLCERLERNDRLYFTDVVGMQWKKDRYLVNSSCPENRNAYARLGTFLLNHLGGRGGGGQ